MGVHGHFQSGRDRVKDPWVRLLSPPSPLLSFYDAEPRFRYALPPSIQRSVNDDVCVGGTRDERISEAVSSVASSRAPSSTGTLSSTAFRLLATDHDRSSVLVILAMGRHTPLRLVKPFVELGICRRRRTRSGRSAPSEALREEARLRDGQVCILTRSELAN